MHGDGGPDLRTVASAWASPKASDPEKAGPNMRGSKGDVPLPGQAANWPGALFRPPSSPARPIAGGSTCSTDGPNSNQPSVKRKLNPIFVEALMRWPTGLSGFERPAMASILSPRPGPGSTSAGGFETWRLIQSTYLAALCSTPIEQQGRLL